MGEISAYFGHDSKHIGNIVVCGCIVAASWATFLRAILFSNRERHSHIHAVSGYYAHVLMVSLALCLMSVLAFYNLIEMNRITIGIQVAIIAATSVCTIVTFFVHQLCIRKRIPSVREGYNTYSFVSIALLVPLGASSFLLPAFYS